MLKDFVQTDTKYENVLLKVHKKRDECKLIIDVIHENGAKKYCLSKICVDLTVFVGYNKFIRLNGTHNPPLNFK